MNEGGVMMPLRSDGSGGSNSGGNGDHDNSDEACQNTMLPVQNVKPEC